MTAIASYARRYAANAGMWFADGRHKRLLPHTS